MYVYIYKFLCSFKEETPHNHKILCSYIGWDNDPYFVYITHDSKIHY